MKSVLKLLERNKIQTVNITADNVVDTINRLKRRDGQPISINYKIFVLTFLKQYLKGSSNITATAKDFKERRNYRKNLLDAKLYENLLTVYITLLTYDPVDVTSRSQLDLRMAILLWGYTSAKPKSFSFFQYNHFLQLSQNNETIVRNVKIVILDPYLAKLAEKVIEKLYNYRKSHFPSSIELPTENGAVPLEIRNYNDDLLISVKQATLNRNLRELYAQITKKDPPNSFGFQKCLRVDKYIFINSVKNKIIQEEINFESERYKNTHPEDQPLTNQFLPTTNQVAGSLADQTLRTTLPHTPIVQPSTSGLINPEEHLSSIQDIPALNRPIQESLAGFSGFDLSNVEFDYEDNL